MTPADQDAYRAAWAVQQKLVPRGEVVNHVIWRDGQMTCLSGRPERAPAAPEPPSTRRGIGQGRLL